MGYIDKVNIKHGTASERRFSHGNTLPLVTLPHALASFSLQTNSYREEWFYSPYDRSFEGIRLTHRPSPWIGDFAYFVFMPQADGVYVDGNARWSGFRASDTVMRPDRLELTALRYGARISLAPTDTGAVIRTVYDEDVETPRFAVLPPDFDGEIEIDEKKRIIKGYTTAHNSKTDCHLKCYFVFAFDCAIGDSYVTNGRTAEKGSAFKGKSAGANVALSEKEVEIRIAISYIGYEQAEYNLQRDTAGGFAHVAAKAQSIWESKLGKIRVRGDEEKERTFYSCLYRAYLYPTKFYEVDKEGRKWHVLPEKGEIKEGVMYTNNGFWDTYRTVYPLFSLIEPTLCKEFVEAWLNYYDDTGYLPRWISATENGSMSGTLVEAVIADAAVKGLLSEEECIRALKAMISNAEIPSEDPLRGRKCVDFYRRKGYIPYDLCRESVNETLDCAYGDFCIAQVAEVAEKHILAEKYFYLSNNYKNVFDRSVGFMRARNSKGKFRPEFDKLAWGLDYTECSAWQTTLAVPHDVAGLAELFGGKHNLEAYVDRLFAAKPSYKVGGYGEEIHEMTEMAAVDFGQCAISNQPSFHIPFIYAALSSNGKSAQIVKDIVEKLFSSADDGYPGDEDNGTMACWYIFACLGFYPYCPGKAEYVVTAPLFDKAEIVRDDGVIDVVKATNKKSVVAHDELLEALQTEEV